MHSLIAVLCMHALYTHAIIVDMAMHSVLDPHSCIVDHLLHVPFADAVSQCLQILYMPYLKYLEYNNPMLEQTRELNQTKRWKYSRVQ